MACQTVDWQNGHRLGAACKTHEFLLPQCAMYGFSPEVAEFWFKFEVGEDIWTTVDHAQLRSTVVDHAASDRRFKLHWACAALLLASVISRLSSPSDRRVAALWLSTRLLAAFLRVVSPGLIWAGSLLAGSIRFLRNAAFAFSRAGSQARVALMWKGRGGSRTQPAAFCAQRDAVVVFWECLASPAHNKLIAFLCASFLVLEQSNLYN
ncbi:hypothetical protein FB45DRAFT_873997 [Roridomyces roridus]|uniref:Uncharacterized protein n=1 Tax=Roridomyces roridus TaxID=1738132 RepID=A0AAD7FBR7_9AGAR|nr:hypothetical protein FB45DRAFT_873997 [Roridomyces roridus]